MELFFPHHFQVPNPAVTVSSNHARLVSFLETGISSLINCDELSLADQVASGRLQLRPQSTVLLGDKKIWGLVKTCKYYVYIYIWLYMHMYIYTMFWRDEHPFVIICQLFWSVHRRGFPDDARVLPLCPLRTCSTCRIHTNFEQIHTSSFVWPVRNMITR